MSSLLVGCHGPNRYWERALKPTDKDLIRRGRLRALVLMSYQSTDDFVWAQFAGLLVLCRLTNDGGWGSPAEFFARHRAKVAEVRRYCQRFVLGNEPNVPVEERRGSPAEWREWTRAAYALFKAEFPDLGFAAAPISPSAGDVEAWRAAIEPCDFLALHAYWQSDPEEALEWLDRNLTGAEAHVTEYNRVGGPDVAQYERFLRGCAARGIASASYFILSGTDDWRHYWLSEPELGVLGELNGEVAPPAQPPVQPPPVQPSPVQPSPVERRAPEGKGWWIWYLDRALHGRSYEQFAAVCRAHGIGHIYVKAGDGERGWAQFAPCVAPLKAAGLRVYSWSYCYGDDWGGEANVALAALAAGSDGHVFDVEAECEGKGQSVLRTLEAVRERHPDAWLATAPLPVIDYHEPALYTGALRFIDAFLPQFYWRALGSRYGDLDYLFGLWGEWYARWASEGHRLPALMPIGQAYGEATPAEIAEFAARCARQGCQAVSFWEWAESNDAQWEAVAVLDYRVIDPWDDALNGVWHAALVLEGRGDGELAALLREKVIRLKALAGR